MKNLIRKEEKERQKGRKRERERETGKARKQENRCLMAT